MSIISKMYAEKDTGNVWANKTHLLSLAKYVALSDVPKLRACHQAALRDPGVIVGGQNEMSSTLQSTESTTSSAPSSTLEIFMMKPPRLVKAIKDANCITLKKEQVRIYFNMSLNTEIEWGMKKGKYKCLP
jgi:hypothetical protein